MKRAAWVCLVAMLLPGCSTTQAYQQYALAIQHAAEARSAAQVEQSKAIMQLAMSGDATTKTVAVMLLAMQAGAKEPVLIEPPRNEALQWAQVLMPTITALGLGYWGYQLGKTQSNNAADVSIAGYGAMSGIANGGFTALGQFRPIPFDWSGLAALQPNVTNTTTIGGDGVIGSGSISRYEQTTTSNP
jgi:hypothetical protein